VPPSRGSAARSSARSWMVPSLSVLVVDDVEDTREAYARYFTFRGLRSSVARDGMEALQILDLSRPDAIVLDLAMPRITGWDVVRELKANPYTRRIPVLALSGQNARESALSAGADAYVEKPCGPEELVQHVLALVRRVDPRRGQ
jgi:two-component system response regulator MprA